MKVTLTRDQVTEMMLCLKGALEQGKNIPYKWKYALAKNVDKLESEGKIIKTALEPKPIFFKYNEERIKLAEIFCDKDEQGNPIFIGDNITAPKQYKITEKRKDWENELKSLESKPEYKEMIAERDRMNTEAFRNETQDYELYEIRITEEQLEQLEKNEIIIPGPAFRFTQKIMVEAPKLQVV